MTVSPQMAWPRYRCARIVTARGYGDHRRRGVALMVAVVTLVILSLMMSAIAWQILANRRMLEHRHYQMQSEWLARAGVEVAAARLLANPAGYTGETIQPIPLASVRIEVAAQADNPAVFNVTSEARFPTDAIDFVARSIARQYRRTTEGGQIRLEIVRE